MPSLPSFQAVETEAHDAGHPEGLERRWALGEVVPEHTHPFEVRARVVHGERWPTVGGLTRHLPAGERFELACDEPHAERYGPDGAVYRVARRA